MLQNQFSTNKMEHYSTTYIHLSYDSILELWRAFPNATRPSQFQWNRICCFQFLYVLSISEVFMVFFQIIYG